jgi:TnpA family transposase
VPHIHARCVALIPVSKDGSCRAIVHTVKGRTIKSSYSHIEPLFGGVIDWGLIERHWQDLVQVVLSIRAGTITAEAILRRLGAREP